MINLRFALRQLLKSPGFTAVAVLTLALGAQVADVLGTALGLVGAFGFGRVLTSLLFQVEATDAPTLLEVPAILMGAALVACALPARRAAKLDPVELLRT